MALTFRTRRSDGVILAEHRFECVDEDELAAAEDRGIMASDQADAALAEGYSVTLEVRDDEGDVQPAGEWIVAAIRHP